MAFYFERGTFITRTSTLHSNISKAARKSYAVTDKAVDTLTTAHQPLIQTQNQVTSTLISVGLNLALIRYQTRRLTHGSHWHKSLGTKYWIIQAADIAMLLWDIAYALLEPILWAIINIIIYALVSLATLGLIFYILFIL